MCICPVFWSKDGCSSYRHLTPGIWVVSPGDVSPRLGEGKYTKKKKEKKKKKEDEKKKKKEERRRRRRRLDAIKWDKKKLYTVL